MEKCTICLVKEGIHVKETMWDGVHLVAKLCDDCNVKDQEQVKVSRVSKVRLLQKQGIPQEQWHRYGL